MCEGILLIWRKAMHNYSTYHFSSCSATRKTTRPFRFRPVRPFRWTDIIGVITSEKSNPLSSKRSKKQT